MSTSRVRRVPSAPGPRLLPGPGPVLPHALVLTGRTTRRFSGHMLHTRTAGGHRVIETPVEPSEMTDLPDLLDRIGGGRRRPGRLRCHRRHDRGDRLAGPRGGAALEPGAARPARVDPSLALVRVGPAGGRLDRRWLDRGRAPRTGHQRDDRPPASLRLYRPTGVRERSTGGVLAGPGAGPPPLSVSDAPGWRVRGA